MGLKLSGIRIAAGRTSQLARARQSQCKRGSFAVAGCVSLITNYPLFFTRSSAGLDLRLLDDSACAVLICARDLVHKGWRLANHPLYGNFRPHQQSYRSLIQLPSAKKKSASERGEAQARQTCLGARNRYMLPSRGLLHDTWVYGVDAKKILPTLIGPTETTDGAIISANCVSACDKNSTYMHLNTPVIKSLHAHHGKDINFGDHHQ